MIQATKIEDSVMFDVVVLHDTESRFVVLADQISSFENSAYPSVDGSGQSEDNSAFEVINLSDYLSYEITSTRPNAIKRLAVPGLEQSVVFQTHARLTLTRLRHERFYRLPSLLRESGCEEWVRGIALLDPYGKTGTHGDPVPAIWIDLRSLAKRVTTR